MRRIQEMRALEHRLALSRVGIGTRNILKRSPSGQTGRMSDRIVQELESRGVLIERTVLEEQIACQYHKKAVQDRLPIGCTIPMGRLRTDTSSSLSPIPTPPSSSPIPELRRRLSHQQAVALSSSRSSCF